MAISVIEGLHRRRHPLEKFVEINNPDALLALRLFLSVLSASDNVYSDVQEDMFQRHPEDQILLASPLALTRAYFPSMVTMSSPILGLFILFSGRAVFLSRNFNCPTMVLGVFTEEIEPLQPHSSFHVGSAVDASIAYVFRISEYRLNLTPSKQLPDSDLIANTRWETSISPVPLRRVSLFAMWAGLEGLPSKNDSRANIKVAVSVACHSHKNEGTGVEASTEPPRHAYHQPTLNAWTPPRPTLLHWVSVCGHCHTPSNPMTFYASLNINEFFAWMRKNHSNIRTPPYHSGTLGDRSVGWVVDAVHNWNDSDRIFKVHRFLFTLVRAFLIFVRHSSLSSRTFDLSLADLTSTRALEAICNLRNTTFYLCKELSSNTGHTQVIFETADAPSFLKLLIIRVAFLSTSSLNTSSPVLVTSVADQPGSGENKGILWEFYLANFNLDLL
ncbi:hypothetical protein GALMADRAFT_144245 [Galerina marginata CBS 339.88]|uniref:Uncharacterized protein n=1 Tax=Galerina marginata (strain CBS 339.88) TaxID=685588 RepID=A0A067SU02_GALM3|nr:hypothetical protein GALMADRAFT_144245 [Galerina marginata CBS 339.88]